jgi:Uncharacterised protein family (UPF0175)
VAAVVSGARILRPHVRRNTLVITRLAISTQYFRVGGWYNSYRMQHVTIALPDELSAALAAPGQDLTRAAFETLTLAAYRERKISASQLRRLLGYETRIEVDAFLKSHGVELEYTLEDIERDRDTHRQLGL